ncbi:MAG: 3',5'-cyclic-nucleotide phosphodiesterase [Pseudomonadota bacterium]
MRLKTLGCSGGIGAGARTSAMLVNNDILIDAGTGVGDLEPSQLANIRHVFLTHSHLDHIASLPLLLDSVFDSLGSDCVRVYARDETIEALQTHIFNWVIWPDFASLPSAENPVLRFEPFNPGQTIRLDEFEISAVEVEHTVPSQGFVMSSGKSTLAISGDTSTNQTLWPYLNELPQLETLIVEVSFADEQADLAKKSGHYTPATMVSDLKKLKHKPALWLNAMKPGEEQQILGQVRAALPGREVNMLARGVSFEL